MSVAASYFLGEEGAVRVRGGRGNRSPVRSSQIFSPPLPFEKRSHTRLSTSLTADDDDEGEKERENRGKEKEEPFE